MNRKLRTCAGFVALLVVAVSAHAQQPKKIFRIAYVAAVSAAADAPRLAAFRQGLRDMGYIEGRNVVVHYRHESGGFDKLPQIVSELLAEKPDVFVAVTTNAAQAVQRGTATIPIIFMGVTDPISAGL